MICALALASCSAQDQDDEPSAATSGAAHGTVAAMVAGSAQHRELAAALADTQLAPVLDGREVYTFLAPTDDAFAKLGAKGSELSKQENRALMVAILRAHILPGEVTREAIGRAIARRKGPVEMRTLAGNNVRFSETPRGITVSNGTVTASLAEPPQTGSNGAVLPIDSVLMPAQ